MNNPMITDALLDGRSIIVVGHAPLDSKVTAFQSLVDALANKRKLGVIDEHHVLPTVPPSATVIGLFPFECVRAVLHHLLCE